MGLLTRLKAAALFGCLLFSSFSFAEPYYFSRSPSGTHFSSASAACDIPGQSVAGYPAVFEALESFGGGTFRCMFRYLPAPEPLYPIGYVGRYGDSCAPGTGPYNEEKGECPKAEPEKEAGEKCDDQTGGTASNPMIWDATTNKCAQFTDAKGDAPCSYLASIGGSGTAYTVAGTLDKGGNAVAPPSFADSAISCSVQTVSSSECTVAVGGAISCNVIGKLTGLANPQGAVDAADAACPNGKCPVKEPQTNTSESGCSPAGNGSGGSTCNQTKETTQEGTQQCGTVNGAYQCITKKPSSNGISTTITSTSETLPDGSIKVTTVKDSSNTVCTDVKTCTTQTSTTTSHSTTKPNGTTSTDSSCKGACTPNGGGLETNPAAGSGNTGNGNGNGNGTCTGSNCGEGGDGSASTTDDCAVPPPCDGDPFLCAILKQDHIDTCKLMADATSQQKAESKAKTDAAYAALDAHQAQMDSQVNGLLGQFQSNTGGNGTAGKCLPDKQIPIAGFTTINLEFSKACESISWVRLVLLAGAYLFAARIVFKEV